MRHMGKSLLEDQINKANIIHNGKYDYSLIKDYKGVMEKYPVKCPIHGIWNITLDNHINKKTGCPKCSGKQLSNEEKIKIMNDIHGGKYDYSLISEKIINKKKYPIICPEHGIFYQTWDNHKKQNCPKCAKTGRKKLTLSDLKEKITNLNTDYDYVWDSYQGYNKPFDIICKKHGIFKQSIANHIFGQRCPKCNRSIGEEKIEEYLILNNIRYETQKSFKECINPNTGYMLRFDFYLPDYNILIEYDGELHFKSVDFFGGNETYSKNIVLDEIKNTFCGENSIKLIRIPYFDLKNIYSILNDNLYYEDEDLNILKIEKYKTDYSKRFGIKGINKNYFINESKKKLENNIRIIWIKDFEINNERKWNVLQSYIKSDCGIIDNRIYARDCEFRLVDSKLARIFEEKNSFYGKRGSSLNVGLFTKKNINDDIPKDTLVMLYTFGHPYFSKGKYDLEVLRASTLLNTQVVGGASKLLKNFYKKYETILIKDKKINVDRIIFYVDADHNTGNSLEKIGFKFIEWKEPGFMNVDSKTKIASHRQPMKHKEIMEKISKGLIYEVANAGVKTYISDRKTLLQQ